LDADLRTLGVAFDVALVDVDAVAFVDVIVVLVDVVVVFVAVVVALGAIAFELIISAFAVDISTLTVYSLSTQKLIGNVSCPM
jgi:hypothetical protein